MSIRTQRINSELQKALSEIIREIKDPRVTQLVSIMSVDTSPDLKSAKVYISIYGDRDKVDATFDGLLNSVAYIKNQIKVYLKMRQVPDIQFLKDGTLEYADKINKLFERIASKDNNND